ncbi:putative bifunctional diguanylate cyclase/phosphodiesterase [Frateuria aurantia]
MWAVKPHGKPNLNPASAGVGRTGGSADRSRLRPAAGKAPSDDLPVPAWVMNRLGMLSGYNEAFSHFTGLPAGATRLVSWRRLVHPDDLQLARSAFNAAREAGRRFQHQLRLRHRDGHYRWVRLQLQAPNDKLQDLWSGACIDVHDHILSNHKLREDLKDRIQMLDVSVDCIKLIDTDGNVLRMNKAGCLALGVPVDEVRFGMKWLGLLPPEIRVAGRKAIQQARQGQPARFSGKSVAADGLVQYWDNMLTPVHADDGSVKSILCISREITAQREAQQRLRIASEVDTLTGLLNRRSFETKIRRLLTRARRSGGQIGLLLIDLDHFKHINDTLGHSAGDHLLRSLARRLNQELQSEQITVCRLGGDEFAIIVDDIRDQQRLLDVARRAAHQLDAPISFGGHFLNGGMSIGAALYPQDAHTVTDLVACADTALNDLKAGGRGGVRLFTPALLQQAEVTAEQLGRARMIIRGNGAEPYYQPKVDLASGRLIGLEALLRWHQPDGSLGYPTEVAEAFDDYELATGIGEMMQSKVFTDLAAWRDQGLPLVPVSINVTPVEFLRGHFAQRLLARMQRHRISPQWIEIEVTEQMLSSRHAEFIAQDLRLLKSQGVTITLDDFGTGHSSFTHLRDYPIDTLKIDSSFVRRIDVDPSSLAVVKAVIALGALFKVEVIAEGVETEVQRQLLQEAGCRWGQGFLFTQALAPAATRELLTA